MRAGFRTSRSARNGWFCGEAYFQTKLPLDRTSMSVWRGRIGGDTLEALLAETLAAAMRAKAVDSSQMQRVAVDTTAQTKAIAHPTDSYLLLRAIEWLNKLAKKQGVKLRQSYLRLATRARREVGRLIHGRGHKQAMRFLRKMRTWAGRLVRDIERKIEGQPDLIHACEPKLERVKQFLAQKPDDKNKIYALHAPGVECIAKGKARTRCEFGVKVSIAVTNARAEGGGQFVLGIRSVPGLPYDGHTLKDQIAQVERLTGVGHPRLCRQRLSPASKRQIFMCRKARSNEARPSSENCEDAAPSNQLSVTPKVKAILSETIWPEPEATRSTPSRRRRPQYPAAPGLAEAFFVVLFGAHSVGSFTVNDLRKVVINAT